MAVNAGDSACSSGLSQLLLSYWQADTRAGFSSPLSTAQLDMLKAMCWAQGQGVASAVNTTIQPVFAHYYSGFSQSFANGAEATVQFNTKVEDTHSAVTPGSGWVFTCPTGRGGLYTISAAVLLAASTSGGTGWLDFFVGATEIRRGVLPATGTYSSFAMTSTVRLADGNTFSAKFINNTGVTQTASAALPETWVTIARIGD